MNLTTHFLSLDDTVPLVAEVSAVFLVAIRNNEIVAIRNHRGWDVPGGHVEEGETLHDALFREVREEACMTCSRPVPFVRLSNDACVGKYAGKSILGFVTDEFALYPFVEALDSTERKIMTIPEFFQEAHHEWNDLRAIVEKAQEMVLSPELRSFK